MLPSTHEHAQTVTEDAKGVIRNHNSNKDRKYNCQNNKEKRTNNDLQNTTQTKA